MLFQLALCVAQQFGAVIPTPVGHDPREDYDVTAYRLDLRVEPDARRLSGTVAIEARVSAEHMTEFVLDLDDACRAQAVIRVQGDLAAQSSLDGMPLRFEQGDDRLVCQLAAEAHAGDELTVAVRYTASPRARDRFSGFHWKESADGQPWIATSYQSLGAHHWWPCKASYFHPEDKPERVWINVSVPGGLTAVANGRATGTSPAADGFETWHWDYPYPLETYLVAINVGPYVSRTDSLALPGIEHEVPFVRHVLPEDAAKADVTFAEVPELLSIYSRAFGPWPFPEARVGIVQAPFLGMEHSTSIAYGSSFPRWLAQQGQSDRLEHFNRHFDYILVHELAHEWWGNSVSVADWSDFWLHEGFATYAGSLVIEARKGRRAADVFFDELEPRVGKSSRLSASAGANAGDAYSPVLYYKGAWVLNTLRHYVDDEAVFWRSVRGFQERFRHKNASTADLQAVFEDESGDDWSTFFREWIDGEGYPRVTGEVTTDGNRVGGSVHCDASGSTPFHVPLDLVWREGEVWRRERVVLSPGVNPIAFECASEPRDLRVVHLDRVLGPHDVRVRAR